MRLLNTLLMPFVRSYQQWLLWQPFCSCVGIDLDEARRKREDNIVQLRKDKRDENLQKKRMTSSVMVQESVEDQKAVSTIQQKVCAVCVLRCVRFY